MAQDKLFLAFWNLENLFDVELADRPEKIRNSMKNDLRGWNDDLLDCKLSQLSKVIRSMNGNIGPDILGSCEVENRNVLEKLSRKIAQDGGRRYAIAHADTNDERGIDVAFLYDDSVATVGENDTFQHWVVKRAATRDLFQVNFTIDEKTLVLVGNHWPSRSAGQYQSEPYRMVAGETLAYWIERIHEMQHSNVPIVVMGDFNDEPFNRSLTEYALSTNELQMLAPKKRNKYLLNLMWPFLAEGVGSYQYEGEWNMLDQILVNKPIVNGKSGWTISGSARIECRELMADPETGAPRRFGIKPTERNKQGFSDHFPVSVQLLRAGG